MKIELKQITIKELVEKYSDNDEEGVFGYDGKLNIRPPYQREFIYDEKRRNEVIKTVYNKLPLSIFYWATCNDGTYEVLDGQQRTISICSFVNGDFSVILDDNARYFHNFTKQEKEEFLDYELLIYECSGSEKEKMDWFRVINIATAVLTNQEIRNAVYHGSFVTDARKYFSKTNCPAYNTAEKYLAGNCLRQDYLETALEWISQKENTTIDDYMALHQNDISASPLYSYFSKVIAWTKATFPNYRKEMKGLPWGILYNKYYNRDYDINALENEIKTLMQDDDITSQKGIYEYLLSGKAEESERLLSIRKFTDRQKRKAYERQSGICPKCGKHFEFVEMDGDHITPWSKGGKTTDENCQMLCKKCNNKKSNN